MLKIYVISSWNSRFTLRSSNDRACYDVYDFRAGRVGWHEIDGLADPGADVDAHHHPRAVQHHKQDMNALANAIAKMPCYRSVCRSRDGVGIRSRWARYRRLHPAI